MVSGGMHGEKTVRKMGSILVPSLPARSNKTHIEVQKGMTEKQKLQKFFKKKIQSEQFQQT